MFVTIDTSPIAIDWVVKQDDVERTRFAIRSGQKSHKASKNISTSEERTMWCSYYYGGG